MPKTYRCGICGLSAKFIPTNETVDRKSVRVTAHSATLKDILSRSLALNVPVTHRAVPIRETNDRGQVL